MMAVSKEAINMMIAKKAADLAEELTKEFGGMPSQWLLVVHQSDLYANLLDPKTHMWSEGTMYLRDTIVSELKKKGVM